MAKYRDTVETLISARNEVAGELQRAERQMKEQAARERQRSQEQERFAKERAQVEREIRVESLRQVGEHAQAETVQIRQAFADRIRAAREAGQMELATRLRVLAQLRQAEAQAAADRTRIREQEAVRQRQLLTGVRTLAGRAAGIGSVMFVASEIEQMAGAMAEAADKGDSLTTAFLRNLPVAGRMVQTGESLSVTIAKLSEAHPRLINGVLAISPLLGGAALAMRRYNLETLQAKRRTEEFTRAIEAQRDFLPSLQEDRRAVELGEIEDEFERAREAQRQAHDRRLREINSQEREIGQAAADIARDFANRRHAQELADIDRRAQAEADQSQEAAEQRAQAAQLAELREREVREQAAEQHIRATQRAEDEITQLHLRQTGQRLEAELHAIRTAAAARIAAAEEAGNPELAQHERTLRDMREREAREHDRRRRQAEELGQQRDSMMEREKALSEQIARARSRNAAAPAPQADQDRFLTGVREMTQQQDRAVQAVAEKQLRALEKQLAETQRRGQEIGDKLTRILESPIMQAIPSSGGL